MFHGSSGGDGNGRVILVLFWSVLVGSGQSLVFQVRLRSAPGQSSGSVRCSVHSDSTPFQTRFRFGVRFGAVNSVNTGQIRSTVGSTSQRKTWNATDFMIASHVLETAFRNYIKLALHWIIQVTFTKYGTVGIGEPMGIRVLSGHSLLKVLALTFTSVVQ